MSLSVQGDCAVCRDTYCATKTPSIIPCGHCFCKECFDLLLKNRRSDGTTACPTCRAPFTRQQITKLRVNATAGPSWSSTASLSSDYEYLTKPIQIFVRTIDDSTITLNVTLSDTILSVKEKIEEWTGTPPSDQRLIYAGRNVGDDGRLLDYRIQRLSTLHLVGRMRGG